jgi:predicted branched-subunit amino acid permease
MENTSQDELARSELVAYSVSVVVAGASTALVMVNLDVAPVVVVAAAIFVFSGTATLAFVGVTDAGGTLATAFAAALLVAARFGLLGIPLSQRFQGRPWKERVLVAFPLLDAAVAMCFRESTAAAGRRSYVRTARVSYSSWVTGVTVGVLLGSLVPDPKALGMDVAFPALLLATAGGVARQSSGLAVTGLIAATIALITTPFTPAGLPVLLAVLASAMGFRAKPTSTGASTGDTTGDAA